MEKSKRKLSRVELKCQLCDASFSRVIALRRHFLNDHEDIEKSEWKCSECDEVCIDKNGLICHFIKTHVAVNQCKKCGKNFRLTRSLRYLKTTLEANHSYNCGEPLFFMTDSHP